MNKKYKLAIIIGLVIIVITIGLKEFFTNGFWYVGDVWCKTIEEALYDAADMDNESKGVLTVKTPICTKEIDDITLMTFVSKDDTLVNVTFVTNKKGLYCVYGYTEEVSLSTPSAFLVTGESDQFVLSPYSTYNDTVCGWCYSNVIPSVNGLTPTLETYEFECQGQKWSLTYWWIDDVNNAENATVSFDLK